MAMMSAVLAFMMSVVVLNLSSAYYWRTYPLCLDVDVNVSSSKGAKIEPLLDSYVELHIPDVYANKTDKFHLEFAFKTNSSESLLFYTRSYHYPTEYMSFSLEKGYLKYKLFCPVVVAWDLLIPCFDTPLNDGRWHTFSFDVKFYEKLIAEPAEIMIDRYKLQGRAYPVSCHRVNTIILGDMRSEDVKYMTRMTEIKGNFSGCIGDLKTNLDLYRTTKNIIVSTCD